MAVAEIDGQQMWQRATIAAVTVSSSKDVATRILQSVELDAESVLGGMLVDTVLEWL